MRRVAAASAFVAIAVVSFAVGRKSAPGAVVERTAPVVPVVSERKAPDRSDDALRECESRVALAEGLLRAQEHEKVGDRVPFPDDLPPQYTPAGFEDAVRRALAACPSSGLEVRRVDCSEFPCMMFFGQARGSYNHAIEGFSKCDAWREQFPGQWLGGGNDLFMTDHGIVEYSYAAPAPEDFVSDENVGKRQSLRATEGRSQMMADADGRDLTQVEQLDLAIEMFSSMEGHEESVAELEAQRAKLVAAAQDASP